MPTASSPSTADRLTPLGPYVTIRLLPDDAPSSVLEVVTAEALTRRAEVLAVGQGVPDLTPGQVVLCRPQTGMTVGDLLLLPHHGILATLNPTE